MKHIVLFALAALIAGIPVSAQPNHYAFQQDMGTYQELTADTAVIPANFGNGDLFAFELNGETFTFFNKNYTLNGVTKLIMFSNSGHMRVDDDSTFIIVDGLFTYLDSIDNNTKLSYKIENTGNDKILKVQWKNLKIRNGQPGNYVNFQMWLYKSKGTFEIHYGPSSANNQSGFTSPSGPNIGIFYSLQSFAKMFEKIWITGDPASYKIDTVRNVSFKAIHGVPPPGTIYRFITKTALHTPVHKAADILFNAYPNPADNEFTVSTSLRGVTEFAITDNNGRVIKILTSKTGTCKIDVSGWASGNYNIITRNSGLEYVKQILVQH